MKRQSSGSRAPTVCLLLAVAGTLLAADLSAVSPNPLSGQYALSGETLIDPPADEPRNSRFNLYLDGAAAADLYRALPGEGALDACLDDGSWSKSSGGIRCTRMRDGRYECAFALVLATGEVRPAEVC